MIIICQIISRSGMVWLRFHLVNVSSSFSDVVNNNDEKSNVQTVAADHGTHEPSDVIINWNGPTRKEYTRWFFQYKKKQKYNSHYSYSYVMESTAAL